MIKTLRVFVNIMMILPFILSYAEIHYHFKYLRPLYFRKHPEIIADLPIRVIKSSNSELPILIICKDAHLYPVEISRIKVQIFKGNLVQEEVFDLNAKIEKTYYSTIIRVNLEKIPVNSFLSAKVIIEYKINGKTFQVVNDNYKGLKKIFFEFFYSEKGLPLNEGWYAGDVHYHSNYTHDQVEFGADLVSTKEFASTIGLSWFFVTDHSYDLDNHVDSWTENDPQLPYWFEMKAEVSRLSDNDVKVIAGEEVSIGNNIGRNVHLIAINNDFIEGSGDSAEIWFKNKPSRNLKEINSLKNSDNLFIAAHPFEKIPIIQRITLRRGNWGTEDFINSGIDYLQIINGNDPGSIYKIIKKWVKLLMQGYRYYILAGNDAHGNFNTMRQIKIPFISLFSSRNQVFGRMFTCYKHEENDPVSGLKKGRIIVSNGPFLDFQIQKDRKHYQIDDICRDSSGLIFFEVATSDEFGEISRINLHIGNLQKKKEMIIKNPENPLVMDFPEKGYLRMSLITARLGIAYTNPIWIERSD